MTGNHSGTGLLACLVLVFAPTALAKDSCTDCHSNMDGALKAPVTDYANDIHARHGFSCADCHGGDRNADDPEAAMSPAKGFKGHVARSAVPALCAHCHSDANLMHRFKPQQRVDQLALYLTSVHGKRLATGDTAAANCVNCHGVHNIREVKDPLSPVHPLKLPETCARCHADAAHMAPYKIATNQFAEYRTSVHWEALSKRGDLSAPNCASCHGNHGATPRKWHRWRRSAARATCCSRNCTTRVRTSPRSRPWAPAAARFATAITPLPNRGSRCWPEPVRRAGNATTPLPLEERQRPRWRAC